MLYINLNKTKGNFYAIEYKYHNTIYYMFEYKDDNKTYWTEQLKYAKLFQSIEGVEDFIKYYLKHRNCNIISVEVK